MACNRCCRTARVTTLIERLLTFVLILVSVIVAVLTYEALRIGIRMWLGPSAEVIYVSTTAVIVSALVLYVIVIRDS